MKNPTRQTDRHVEAVLAACDVLGCFLDRPAWSILELMRATGFTRNRVTRLVGTLAHRGYLTADRTRGVFHTGPALFALGKVFERHRAILSLVRPVLREIALKTGESVSLFGREGCERVVLAREEGTQAIRHAISEGQHMDLHAGAAGKVILAHLAGETVEAILEKTGLPKRTAATITDPGRLSHELRAIRKRGYAISIGERAADAYAIAVPVLGHGHEFMGALAIAGPISRFTAAARTSQVKLLRDSGAKLSRKLGWVSPKD